MSPLHAHAHGCLLCTLAVPWTMTAFLLQACKTEACAIQTCLSKSHYQADKCQEQIQSLMKCCEKYQVQGKCHLAGSHACMAT